MEVISFFESEDKQHWLCELGRSDWRAAAFLARLINDGRFFEAVGERSRILMLVDGGELISFCTLSEKDDIQPTDLTPWIGFVYTFPERRGHRYAGLLLHEAERIAKEEGAREVYLSSNHVGLYEKYGYMFKTTLTDMDGLPSGVYSKRLGVEPVPAKLVEPSMEYDEQIRAYRREFLEFGGSMDGCSSLRRMESTRAWLDHVEELKRPETVPNGLVPMTQYIYVRESDKKVLGVIQIRHYFNEYLEKYAGHIGYSVCPSERRKGYAKQMLRLVLPECKKLGIDRVLITCVKGNEGSKRTILDNGGKYESTVTLVENEGESVELERYWIEL